METVIQLQRVTKRYRSALAVNHMSLDIHAGEIFGIVGPNGAGKTTLIEIAEGLRQADEGIVQVMGMDHRTHAREIKQKIGVQLQTTSIHERAKVSEILHLFSSFYDKKVSLDKLYRFLGLQDKHNFVFKSLSGGWKQRVTLALALIHDPDIVFLDEPSMGLDPHARDDMWELIMQLKEQGKTIVVTTHYMEEAEKLCDRVALIDQGKLIALDAPGKLIGQLSGGRRIGFKNPDFVRKEQLLELGGVTNVDWQSDWITLHSNDSDQTLNQLFHLAIRNEWLISSLKLEDNSMNDVFRRMITEGKGASV